MCNLRNPKTLLAAPLLDMPALRKAKILRLDPDSAEYLLNRRYALKPN